MKNTLATDKCRNILLSLAIAMLSMTALPSLSFADELKFTLSGDQEVPPVKTAASGTASLTINSDMSVSGGVKTTGIVGTMAHIHQGAGGANGPVIIPFSKDGDNGWAVPPGTKMSPAQYQAYKAGDLYINVHSAANKGGEIRGQIKPQ